MNDGKAIINCCLTGMTPTRERSPHVPLTPGEIVRDALAVAGAGAGIVHLHARGPDGHPTWDPAVYAEIIRPLRAQAPDLVICVTTSGRLWSERDKRATALGLPEDCRPDMASLTPGSFNFPGQVSINPPEDIDYLLALMRDRGIRPELEIFDFGMLDTVRQWIDEQRLSPPFYFNLLLGNRGTAAATPANLALLAERLPPGSVWAGAGIGRAQFPMNCLALAMGGHARVGLEDNLYLCPAERQLATNLQLVQRVAKVAEALGRPLATPKECRTGLGLRPAAG
jgi:3-keto-5-aminohexanoate cleavage enzyme